MKKKTIEEVAKNIWEYAEIRFKEYKSAEELCEYAKNAGFKIKKGIGGLETAFKATYGKGSPVIAFLGEYDALQGLSQVADSTKKEKGEQEINGHGCGHHLLGSAALYAAEMTKDHMEKNNLPGTVIFFGCPAEEGGSGKTWMVKDNAFKGVDVALTWHPFPYNSVYAQTTLANYQVYFRFEGKSSHAAASPHLGRSALDAVELMDIGCNYLREHIIPEARLHYAITNPGGISPNVVQPFAEVLYLIRAPKVSEVDDIFNRVCDVARGAALMTGTKASILFDKGCSEYIGNKEIEKLLYNNMKKYDKRKYTKEELAYTKKFKDTCTKDEISASFGWISKAAGKDWPKIKKMMLEDPMYVGTIPYDPSFQLLESGSTDVGDVSKVVPTGQIAVACFAQGTPGHSWQEVAQGKSSVAMKGMKYAADILSHTAIDILEDPNTLKKIKKSFTENSEKYVSPLKYKKEPILL